MNIEQTTTQEGEATAKQLSDRCKLLETKFFEQTIGQTD